MSESLVRLENIKKTYDGARFVLDGLHYSLERGEISAVLGESGCGKSTLLNVIGLLDDYTSGEYYFNGAQVTKKRHALIRNRYMGFVFQLFYLIPGLTVRQNLQLPFLYASGSALRRGYESAEKRVLDLFGISHLAQKKVDFLSGGEKQRAAIARAMILEPPLLIADEPTGALDENNSGVVFHALREYAQGGNSVIVVTHNRQIALNADKTYYLSKGRLDEYQK